MSKNHDLVHALIVRAMTPLRNTLARLASRVLVAVLLPAMTLPAFASGDIVLHALFKDKAIVLIDGKRRVLSAGETSPEGVKLVETDTHAETAEVEIGGQRRSLRLGVVIANFGSSSGSSVTLYAEPDGHFHADGLINNVAVRFLVDTGATTIAMSSDHAERVGIDFRKQGRPGYANTAGGVVRTYNVKLDSVTVGDITLRNVDAGVIEGNFPVEILLGMSFLGRVDLKRNDNRLELIQRY